MTCFNTTVYFGDNEFNVAIDSDNDFIECNIEGVPFHPDGMFVTVGTFPNVETISLTQHLVDMAIANLEEYGGWEQVDRDDFAQYQIDCAKDE